MYPRTLHKALQAQLTELERGVSHVLSDRDLKDVLDDLLANSARFHAMVVRADMEEVFPKVSS